MASETDHIIDGMRVTEVVTGVLPDAKVRTSPLPILVHFHGRGDQPHLPQGDRSSGHPMRHLYPWAPTALGTGFSWFPVSITERNKPEKVIGHHIREGAIRMAGVLTQFLKTELGERPVQNGKTPTKAPTPTRFVLTGFSQGGMMTLALALLFPELVGGAIPVASWLPTFLVRDAISKHTRFPPIRGMHGRGDPIVPLAPTVTLFERLRAEGLDATLEVFDRDDHAMGDIMFTRHYWLVRAMIDANRNASKSAHPK